MNKGKNSDNLDLDKLNWHLQEITTVVNNAAQMYQSDAIALLSLLRQLEKLHREIRDGFFQENLPNNRQALYALLRDIESEGGWPYIERMRLQAFLANATEESEEDKSEEGSERGE